jgi:hypothetical protein
MRTAIRAKAAALRAAVVKQARKLKTASAKPPARSMTYGAMVRKDPPR